MQRNSKNSFCPQKVEKLPKKSCILMAVGSFFLCSPDCPKQPKIIILLNVAQDTSVYYSVT